jgi:predicted transcriptional regulator
LALDFLIIFDRKILRAGRALLGWTQENLAEEAGVSVTAVAHLENTGSCHLSTLKSVVGAFDRAGVILESSGVRIAKQEGQPHESAHA